MGAAVFAVLAGGAYTATRLSASRPGARSCEERPQVRAELNGLLARPEVAAAARCGPITVPNHKLLPEVRWALDLPASGVRARSDRTLDAAAPGLAIVVRPPWDEYGPTLNVYEVPRGAGSDGA